MTETTEARKLADYIFRLDAQYKGGILKAASRDDFIDRCIVPILAAHMGFAASEDVRNEP